MFHPTNDLIIGDYLKSHRRLIVGNLTFRPPKRLNKYDESKVDYHGNGQVVFYYLKTHHFR